LLLGRRRPPPKGRSRPRIRSLIPEVLEKKGKLGKGKKEGGKYYYAVSLLVDYDVGKEEEGKGEEGARLVSFTSFSSHSVQGGRGRGQKGEGGEACVHPPFLLYLLKRLLEGRERGGAKKKRGRKGKDTLRYSFYQLLSSWSPEGIEEEKGGGKRVPSKGGERGKKGRKAHVALFIPNPKVLQDQGRTLGEEGKEEGRKCVKAFLDSTFRPPILCGERRKGRDSWGKKKKERGKG